jgi:hypothetical protein
MEIGQQKKIRELKPLEAPDPRPAARAGRGPEPAEEPAPAGRAGSDDHQVADVRR